MALVHEYDPIYVAKSRRMWSTIPFESRFLSTKVGLLVDNKADSARIKVALGHVRVTITAMQKQYYIF
jgi:hypothetical protein